MYSLVCVKCRLACGLRAITSYALLITYIAELKSHSGSCGALYI